MELDNDRKPGDDYVQSFARGLAVMQSFTPDTQQLTLSDVARRCDITRAGARRLLLTLVSTGYARQEKRWFSLTPNAFHLVAGVPVTSSGDDQN